jgi:hypothetical protein
MYNPRIDTYKIMLIVQAAWDKSFARKDYNRQAIAARGWYPLTRNLLDHPEIASTKQQVAEDNSSSAGQGSLNVAATLNFSNGLGHSCITDIIQNIDLEAVREQIRVNQHEGRQALSTLTDAKKLSAGVLFKSGRAWLGPEVLQVQLEKKRLRDDKEKQIQDKRSAELRRKKDLFDKAWGEVSHLAPSVWTKEQLKALISYKKLKTDKWRLPTSLAALLEKWEIVKDRVIEELPVEPMEENIDEEEE